MRDAPVQIDALGHQTQMADNQYSKRLAQFVSSLSYDNIPQEVRERIKLLLLDSIGCGLYGSIQDHSKIAIDTITELDTSGKCGIWGTGKFVSAPHAALLNGTFVQGFEIDDIHRKAAIHNGAAVLPAISALAEIRPGICGQRFLTAAVAGYEVGPRVGICEITLLSDGWHAGAIVGVFSSGAACASALGLSETQTLHALGIAGTQAAGLMAAQYGSMVKRMQHGKASQSGLYGALLAARGFTGITNVFESEFGGFCTTFSRSKDRYNMNELTSELGERWETMLDSLKFYSAAASNHSTLDAVRIMRTRHPFTVDQLERIVVHGAQVTKDHVFWQYKPSGLTNAQFCMPYVLATFLLEGEFFVDQVSADKLADPERITLSRRVEFKVEPEITKTGKRYYVRVEIFLKDGTHMEETVEAQRGSETRFATEADVVEKFEKLAKRVFPDPQVAAIRDAVLGLDKLDDAAQFAKLLVAK